MLAGCLRASCEQSSTRTRSSTTRLAPVTPDELFADLAELADLGPRARVVEIGPGTGQATVALVGLGLHVVAVELGAALAAVLERKLAAAPVEVVVSTFEDWRLPPEPFDAITAFTAWHWLDPALRTQKAAAALRPGGALGTVTTTHVLGGTAEFFVRVQDCYRRWDPATPPDLRLPAADVVPPTVDEVDHSDLFLPAVRRRYQRDIAYSTRGYLDLLGTYSGHRTMAPERRDGLFDCIGQLVDAEYGGTITKSYLYELRLARRAP